MSRSFTPPLRLTLISSSTSTWANQISELERIVGGSAAGIGWDLGKLESPEPGEESLGETFEMRVFSAAPEVVAPEWLEATLHGVVVALVDEALLEDKLLVAWLEACAEHVNGSDDRHSLMVVPIHEGVQQHWFAASAAFTVRQVKAWSALATEEAGRLDQLALLVLDQLVRSVATPIYRNDDWQLRVFISHAKLDGFQLAQSLRHYLEQQKWLKTFYDADHIRLGEDWQKALSKGVANSVLLVLRTDQYDRRFWCRQEVRWAEVFGVPCVVVDARSGLVHPATDLALDAAPTVRVPDGNLVRALFAVQQSALRSLLFRRRALELRRLDLLPASSDRVKLVAVAPTISAVDYACRQFPEASGTETEARWLLYPDPPLREALEGAAQALADKVGARLGTPQQVLAEAAS